MLWVLFLWWHCSVRAGFTAGVWGVASLCRTCVSYGADVALGHWRSAWRIRWGYCSVSRGAPWVPVWLRVRKRAKPLVTQIRNTMYGASHVQDLIQRHNTWKGFDIGWHAILFGLTSKNQPYCVQRQILTPTSRKRQRVTNVKTAWCTQSLVTQTRNATRDASRVTQTWRIWRNAWRTPRDPGANHKFVHALDSHENNAYLQPLHVELWPRTPRGLGDNNKDGRSQAPIHHWYLGAL